jgi:hypothetical protein
MSNLRVCMHLPDLDSRVSDAGVASNGCCGGWARLT